MFFAGSPDLENNAAVSLVGGLAEFGALFLGIQPGMAFAETGVFEEEAVVPQKKLRNFFWGFPITGFWEGRFDDRAY